MPFLIVGGIVAAAAILGGMFDAVPKRRRGPGGANTAPFARGVGGGGGPSRGAGPSFAQRLQSVLTPITGIDPPSAAAPNTVVPSAPAIFSPSGYTPPPASPTIAPTPGGPGTNVTPDVTPTPVIQSSATVGTHPDYYAPVATPPIYATPTPPPATPTPGPITWADWLRGNIFPTAPVPAQVVSYPGEAPTPPTVQAPVYPPNYFPAEATEQPSGAPTGPQGTYVPPDSAPPPASGGGPTLQ